MTHHDENYDEWIEQEIMRAEAERDYAKEENALEKLERSERVTTKELGKINFAEYGTIKDLPFMIGLLLGFSFVAGGVGDGGKYTVNISKECKWDNNSQRERAVTMSIERVAQILKDAKVNYVSELRGKPVEVTLENHTFVDFRILTEVL